MMKSCLYFVIFCTFLLSLSADPNCGENTCAHCCNDLVSGYRCYDPSLYVCEKNDAGQSVLCAKGFKACGTECYNSSQYICEESEVLCGYLKGKVIKACDGACYDDNVYSCCANKLYLKNNVPASCPGFNSSNPFPAQGGTPLWCSPFSQTPCALGSCCEGECFDATKFVCFDDQLCPIGNKVCGLDIGEGSCYDPNTQECCNQVIYPYGTSVCSKADATCCSCSCSSTVIQGMGSSTYTVDSPAHCTPSYINTEFSGSMNCPGYEGSCYGGAGASCSDVVNCHGSPMFWDRCGQGPDNYGCGPNGATYICGGGNFSCSVSAHAECPVQTSESYESSYNVTQITPGSTQYEAVPANFAGEVCCWCSSESEQSATSTPVPNIANCNLQYVVSQDYFTAASDAVCSVWSRDLFALQGLDCGLPEE